MIPSERIDIVIIHTRPERQTWRKNRKHTRHIRLCHHAGGPAAPPMYSWASSLSSDKVHRKVCQTSGAENLMIMWFRVFKVIFFTMALNCQI